MEHPPMTMTRRFSGITLAALLLVGGLAFSQPASAEDLVDFLWGGSSEFGGGRKVVAFDPQYKAGQIIVSFSDRRLYLITKKGEAITYPVAVPKGDARWQGVTFVSNKRVNPPWTPTPSMLRENPRLPHWVPGGHPMNPLGVRALYLGSSAYRIHGTDAPWTIGHAVSHGCIRMTNKDVLDLYPRVKVGTRVTVTWQRFTTRPLASGYDDSSDNGGNSDASSGGSFTPAASQRDGSLSGIFFWKGDDAAAVDKEPAQPKKASSEPSQKKKDSASAKPSASKTPKSERVSQADQGLGFILDWITDSQG
jgi:hypothetical protein